MQDNHLPTKLTAAERQEVARLFGDGALDKASEKASCHSLST